MQTAAPQCVFTAFLSSLVNPSLPPSRKQDTMAYSASKTKSNDVTLLALSVACPFLVYLLVDVAICDLSIFIYRSLIVMLSFTGLMLWWKMFTVLGRLPALRRAGSQQSAKTTSTDRVHFPAASAVIAGHLPADAEGLVKAAEAFLTVEYPGPLQVVLAFSTEGNIAMPEAEAAIANVARLMPERFCMYRLVDARSQQEAVEAAARLATGEFVGVFTAGHVPAKDCMIQALNWAEAQNAKQQMAVDGQLWGVSALAETVACGSDSGICFKLESAIVAVVEIFADALSQADSSHRWSELRAIMDTELSTVKKSELCCRILWKKVFPWVAIQLLPLFAFLCYKESGIRSLDGSATSRLATSLMMSSY